MVQCQLLLVVLLRAASIETLEAGMPLSSDTLPDDDREARAALNQQEQHQVLHFMTVDHHV